jgi:hypothetical protein
VIFSAHAIDRYVARFASELMPEAARERLERLASTPGLLDTHRQGRWILDERIVLIVNDLDPEAALCMTIYGLPDRVRVLSDTQIAEEHEREMADFYAQRVKERAREAELTWARMVLRTDSAKQVHGKAAVARASALLLADSVLHDQDAKEVARTALQLLEVKW